MCFELAHAFSHNLKLFHSCVQEGGMLHFPATEIGGNIQICIIFASTFSQCWEQDTG